MLHLATPDGVFKSLDGGWRGAPASTGITNTLLLALVIDPLDPDTLYAGTLDGVYKSEDGGQVGKNAAPA